MNIKNMLFTELAMKYNLTNEIKYKNEMLNRLKFCTFDEKTTDYIINLETNIIKKRKMFFEKNMIDIFSWLNYIPKYRNNADFKLFNMPLENYAQIDSSEVLPSTLSIGEIAILYADARILSEYGNIIDIPQNMLNDINNCAVDKNNCASKLKLIYLGKFDLIHMMVNNCESSREYYILCARFFRNEVQLVINNKWFDKYGIDVDKNIVRFKPYSIEYFNYFETN